MLSPMQMFQKMVVLVNAMVRLVVTDFLARIRVRLLPYPL